MFTLAAGQSRTVFIPQRQALTITADAAAVGSAVRMAYPVGGEPYSPVAINGGASITLGPYSVPANVQLSCSAGGYSASIDEVAANVLAEEDELTGRRKASAGGVDIRNALGGYGQRLAIFGDSRIASAYPVYTPTALSLSGQTATITATGIGTRQVGEQLTLGRNTGIDYMRATIATVTDANNITATVVYPASGLPSGSVFGAGSTIVVREARPTLSASYPSWLLAMLGQPFDQVQYYGYAGCRVEGVIEYQARDASAQGFDAAWVHISANNWLTAGNNQAAPVVTPMLDRLLQSLNGAPVWFLLEPPLSGAVNTATQKARVQEINAWATATSGARIIDIATPMDDGTGGARADYLSDGLHPATKGALNAALSAYPNTGILPVARSVNSLDAGGAHFPLANPTLTGTLGANLPTGYTKGVSGLVTETSFNLAAKEDGAGNEFSAVVAATGAGSHFFRSASIAVTAAGKYRFRCKVTISGGVGIDYPEVTVRNQSGDANIQNLFAGANTAGNGSADGTYTIWTENDVVIPAAVTAAYIRPRIWFDSTGGATITYSDFQAERIS